MGALIDTEISVHFRLRSTLRTGQGSFTMNTTDTARKLARAILEVDADPTDVADAAMLVLLNLIHAKGGNRAEGIKAVALTMLFAEDWTLDRKSTAAPAAER
jgi:hypothetical protein